MDAFGCWIGLLIGLQGHSSFLAREAATQVLTKFGESTSPWLAATRGHQDKEIVWRSARLLDRNQDAWLDALGKLPWIDALPPDWPERCAAVTEYLTDHQAGDPQDWPGYRAATRNYLADRLRLGMDRRAVLRLLQVMRGRELFWAQNRRYPD